MCPFLELSLTLKLHYIDISLIVNTKFRVFSMFLEVPYEHG